MEISFSPFSILLLSISLIIFMLFKMNNNSTSNSKHPPGPRKFPLIGNLHLLVSDRLPHHILRDLATKYGSIMHLKLGEISTVVISTPESAKEVMKTHDLNFATRPSMMAAEVLYYGRRDIAFSPYGAYWRQMRKIATLELLSVKRVQSFRHIREAELLNQYKWIASNEGSEINLTERIIATTYDIISRSSLIGEKSNEQKLFISIVKEASDALGAFHIADLYPSVKFLHHVTGMKAKIDNLHKKTDGILSSIIRQRKLIFDSKKKEEDLLDVLLNIQAESTDLELPMTTNDIKAVMLVVFLAGSETSSTTADWAMSEMMNNPRILNKAQEEVRRVFDGKGGFVDESHLDELKYLKLVIKETLRMHPSAPLLVPRESRENSEVLGYEIPAKTQVIVNAWAINRDKKHWKDADTFIPERFLDSHVDFRGNDFHYIPFGAGRRICPGISFGLANVETQLALLLYHFDWSLPGGKKPEEMDMSEDFGITCRKKCNLCLIPTVVRPLTAT